MDLKKKEELAKLVNQVINEANFNNQTEILFLEGLLNDEETKLSYIARCLIISKISILRESQKAVKKTINMLDAERDNIIRSN